MHTVQRTLVKSPPELWAEVSDPASLARRLDAFGEIAITDLRPESRVAWAAEGLEGSVELEPSGWGTKVTLTAAPTDAAEDVAEVVAEPLPEPAPESEPAARPGLVARIWRAITRSDVPAPAPPEAAPEPEPSPAPAAPGAERTEAVLSGVLDDLGAAHHRPFSR